MEISACHECDHLVRHRPLPHRGKANCVRCGALLYRHVPGGLDRALALYIAAFALFLVANLNPFLAMKVAGLVQGSQIYSAGWALFQLGMGELAVLVLMTSIVFPGLVMVGMLWLLVPARFGRLAPGAGPVYRMVRGLQPWSLMSVFLLGALISVVKLKGLATVVPGVAIFSLGVLVIVYNAARSSFEPHQLWALSPHRQLREQDLQPGSRLISCHTCELLRTADAAGRQCVRCGSRLHHRRANALARTRALLASAAVMMIPANLYPIMTVRQLGRGEPDTILSGITRLIEAGLWGLALIVFFASIAVPVMKLIALAFLLRSVEGRSRWRRRDRTLLYRVTEMVGAWSMVDVFLVGLLSALVSLSVLAEITPGVGATFFAAVVVLTMFAAHSFDPRLIWDRASQEESGSVATDAGLGSAAPDAGLQQDPHRG